MAWCEANDLRYIFGLSGNAVLDQMVEPLADAVRAQRAAAQAKLVEMRRADRPVDAARLRRAEAQANAVRRHTEVSYGAKSWRCQRRVAARIEATPKGLDIRYVVTNLTGGGAEWLYETLYCARGQMENFIKLHKTQLASDRTSCRSPLANQVRLVLHTGAYWLLLKVRAKIPQLQPLATARLHGRLLGTRLVVRGHSLAESSWVLETPIAYRRLTLQHWPLLASTSYPHPKFRFSFNFKFRRKIPNKILALRGTSPTKRATFSYQAGGTSPT